MKGLYIYVKVARPVPNGEMFTLSVRRQECLKKVIFYEVIRPAAGRIATAIYIYYYYIYIYIYSIVYFSWFI